jgi:hypothetical protein
MSSSFDWGEGTIEVPSSTNTQPFEWGEEAIEADESPRGLIPNLIEKFKNPPRRSKPFNAMEEFSQFNKGLGQSAKEYGELAIEHPGKFAGSLGIGSAKAMAFPVHLVESWLRNEGLIDEDTPPNLINDYLNKASEYLQENLSPEEQRKLQKTEELGGTIPLASLVSKGLQGAKNLFKKLPGSPKGAKFPERERSLEIPPDEPPPDGGFPDSIEGKITAPPEYLKSDYEIAEEVRGLLSPLKIESQLPGQAATKTSQTMLAPIKNELDAISPHRVNNARLLGNMTSRKVQQVSKDIYSKNSKNWANARSLASDTQMVRPDLINDLQLIIEETGAPTAGGTARTHTFADKLLNKITRKVRRRGKTSKGRSLEPVPITNEQLIDAIIEARKNGYKYDIKGGEESHRINQFVEAVEKELLISAGPEERQALELARQTHKDWATVFKNKKVIPFRNTNIPNPNALYSKSLDPDTLRNLIPILEQDPTGKGRVLANILKRNLVENTMQKYLLNPKSINPMSLEKDLGKIEDFLPPGQKEFLMNKVQELQMQPGPSAAPAQSKFLTMSESQLSNSLDTIDGLKKLEMDLSKVPGGKEAYNNIAKTKGIDLLFGGQLDISSRSDRIAKMLNDRNGRYYLKETLGDNVVKELDVLARNNKLAEALRKIESSKEMSTMLKDPDILMKSGDLLVSVLKGNPISATRKAYQLYKKIKRKSKSISSPKEISYQIE